MNTWTKRILFKFECPSGNIVTVRRPGPDLMLKSGRVVRILQRQLDAAGDVNKQLAFIESLPDDEIEKLMYFARIVLADVVIDPPLHLHPKEGQLSPDDVPLQDFWALFIAASNGFPSVPVRTKEGETTVDAVTSFPSESIGSDPHLSDSEAVQ